MPNASFSGSNCLSLQYKTIYGISGSKIYVMFLFVKQCYVDIYDIFIWLIHPGTIGYFKRYITVWYLWFSTGIRCFLPWLSSFMISNIAIMSNLLLMGWIIEKLLKQYIHNLGIDYWCYHERLLDVTL